MDDYSFDNGNVEIKICSDKNEESNNTSLTRNVNIKKEQDDNDNDNHVKYKVNTIYIKEEPGDPKVSFETKLFTNGLHVNEGILDTKEFVKSEQEHINISNISHIVKNEENNIANIENQIVMYNESDPLDVSKANQDEIGKKK